MQSTPAVHSNDSDDDDSDAGDDDDDSDDSDNSDDDDDNNIDAGDDDDDDSDDDNNDSVMTESHLIISVVTASYLVLVPGNALQFQLIGDSNLHHHITLQ